MREGREEGRKEGRKEGMVLERWLDGKHVLNVPFSRYLSNIRSAQKAERAGGYGEELACHRALQEAFSALFT